MHVIYCISPETCLNAVATVGDLADRWPIGGLPSFFMYRVVIFSYHFLEPTRSLIAALDERRTRPDDERKKKSLA